MFFRLIWSCTFIQGPCRHGSWLLVKSVESGPTCERNRCLHLQQNEISNRDMSILYSRDGKCWRTQTRAYCPEETVVGNEFEEDGTFGRCVCEGCSFGGYGGYFTIPCRPGFKYSAKHSNCNKILNFETQFVDEY